jgi:hypothetical protein
MVHRQLYKLAFDDLALGTLLLGVAVVDIDVVVTQRLAYRTG